LKCGGALLALKQKLDAAEATLYLSDTRDDAHRIENVGARLVCIVPLRNGENEAVGLQRRLDCAQGSGASRSDRRGETRKDYCSAKWQNRYSLTLSHEFFRSD
jgi:hypothetical protein